MCKQPLSHDDLGICFQKYVVCSRVVKLNVADANFTSWIETFESLFSLPTRNCRALKKDLINNKLMQPSKIFPKTELNGYSLNESTVIPNAALITNKSNFRQSSTAQ